MDRVRSAWTSLDRKPEDHTKASESVMSVMDWLSQKRSLKDRWSGGSGGDVQSCVGGRGRVVGGFGCIVGGFGRAVGGRECDVAAGAATWTAVAAPWVAGTATRAA
jgi:hypothetical protein